MYIPYSLKQLHSALSSVLTFAAVYCRSGRSVWLLGRSYGLGSFTDRAGAGLRVPSHLLLLSFDLGHLPHRAPLQYSRATSGQGPIFVWHLTSQCPPPTERPQQWLRSTGQRPCPSCSPCIRPRPQAKVFLRPGGGQLSDLQCQAAKQGGMQRSG